MLLSTGLTLTAACLLLSLSPAAGPAYPWLSRAYAPAQSLETRFTPPASCRRVLLPAGSFGAWLRGLPLRPAGTPVRLFNGQLKSPQTVHAAVVELDIGPRDLQQCADAVIRLRGEYLFTRNFRQIHFHLTTGPDIWFGDWAAGQGFRVQGETVETASKVVEEPTHEALRRYFDEIFAFASTRSLSRELVPVPLAQVQPGDVFVHAGAPGHAVLVVDVAENPATHQRYMLLAQSYMPAQNVHILLNKPKLRLGPWFAVEPANETLETPEWTFARDELRRFQ